MIADTYANLRQLHLNALDHFIKEQLGCPGYLCYLDDFVVFGNDKTALLEIKQKIEVFLQDFRLLLHERKSRIYRCSEGVTFLGYRVFPDFTLLPSANVRRFRKRARQNVRLYWDKKITLPEFTKRLRAWEGHALRADTWRLRRQLIKEIFGMYPGTPFREVLPRNSVPGSIAPERSSGKYCPGTEFRGTFQTRAWRPGYSSQPGGTVIPVPCKMLVFWPVF